MALSSPTFSNGARTARRALLTSRNLQAEFLRESEQAELKRQSSERKQIEAMNAALSDREDALAREALAQKQIRRNSLISMAVGAALIVAAALAGHCRAWKGRRRRSTKFTYLSRAMQKHSMRWTVMKRRLLFSLQGDPDGPWRLFGREDKSSSGGATRPQLSRFAIAAYL